LKVNLTVSDSKKLFHEKFPYVISGLYKRIIDEMLVELNLLKHQNEFKQEELFCVGLTETFKELTKDYKPKDHLDMLFESLCRSSNFEPSKIKEISEETLRIYKDKSFKEISNLLKEKRKANLYSSRILNLGVYIVISNSNDFENLDEIEKNKIISEIIKSLDLSVSRSEKDIGLYKTSLIKLQQAKELIEESKVKNKGK
tara:strand:+ start:471 stop:1070 length:600 start_codon:yes stop_codon:yes gene_type:complete